MAKWKAIYDVRFFGRRSIVKTENVNEAMDAWLNAERPANIENPLELNLMLTVKAPGQSITKCIRSRDV